ncbi:MULTISPECIES: hypothetical protein [Leuconostoc]|uniref:hypothetical protein n=1 Tax=Leuconostoc TaxID=1243 RepID=UPI000B7CFA12|nr:MULTISPECIES: hypothetical protein [Leuconostoc]MBM7435735.1 hypothetical protein [Leuconostoc rapi]MBZ5958946.1 hypothetical protein [Leuconostoc gasicomitatum]MBZ5982036.1 hypothetical protein [Leuconostoc gasicomitatum]MBZ5987726.1 hypothetical protein [Leuconostoc gasicomitatum]MBZ5989222.1 hypothetical protein [Leuconostoc gasicomitatum]
MTTNDYICAYANNKDDRYHHLPRLEVAVKLSRLLSKRFTVKDIDNNRREMLADKFDITDYSLSKLLTEIENQERFELIVR